MDQKEKQHDSIANWRDIVFRYRVSPFVLDAFYRLVHVFYKETDPDSFPFPYKINGAYPLKHKWEILDRKMKTRYFPDHIDFFPLLTEYGEGFRKGYMNFEDDILKSSISIINIPDNTLNSIYEYVNLKKISANISGFPETVNEEGKFIPYNYFESGLQDGYFYKAWLIILENSKAFEPLFEKESPQLKAEKQFSLYEIGFICYYAGETITQSNAEQLANKYGNRSTSNKLYQKAIVNNKQIVQDEENFTKSRKKFKCLTEKVLPFFKSDSVKTQQIKADIDRLKRNIEISYPDKKL